MLWIIIASMLNFTTAFGQSVIDEISAPESKNSSLSDLPTERIIKVSPSKRILVLSNSQNSYGKGDFITLVIGEQAVTRAIVAKTTDTESGIKTLKVYNSNLWGQLRAGTNVKVVRGDDSFLFRERSQEKEADPSKIRDEDDLFNDSNILEDEVALDENPNRVIKTDNIVTVSYSRIDAINTERQTTSYNQLNGSWAFQMEDNIWVEALYGQSLINDFPAATLDTTLSNLEIRAKYTIAAPYYSYLMPYVGYQILNAQSPNAGQDDGSGNDFEEEASLVEDLKKSQVIFGVSLLKRLVPGWFVRAELGTDLLNIGFALEF